MRSWVMAGACLSCFCVRPPSTVPLGGEEWVPEARHVDKRPRGESAPADSAEPRPRSRPRPVEKNVIADAGARAVAAPKTVARETTFGFSPLGAGTLVTLRTKYTIRATFSDSSADGASNQSIEADAAEKIAIRVVSANDSGAREVDVEYLESLGTMRMDGAPNDEESNAGKRYNVVFSSTDAKVTRKGAALEDDEDRAVLFDLATVTGYFPVLRPHLPRALAPGFRLNLEHRELAKVFSSEDDVAFEGAELVLRGRSASDDKVAVFDCKLPARFEKDGIALRVELRGTVSLRAEDSRPLDVRLSGPLRTVDGIDGEGSLDGHVSVEFSHEYSK